MKKLVYLVILIPLLFSSCEKTESNVKDYFPDVRTVSAVVNADGSVTVTGEIISEGTKPVEIAGFCLDTLPVPDMLSNQAIAVINGNTFSATYTDFDVQTKYYFRSWAVNENGYSYGTVVSLDSVYTTPLVAPCSPAMNTITIGSGTETVTSVSAPNGSSAGWDITLSSNSIFMSIEMDERPRTKIYTTTTSSPTSADQIYVQFYSGFISAALKNGASVYVNQIDANNWEFTICNAPYPFGSSSTAYMTAKFRCPH